MKDPTAQPPVKIKNNLSFPFKFFFKVKYIKATPKTVKLIPRKWGKRNLRHFLTSGISIILAITIKTTANKQRVKAINK